MVPLKGFRGLAYISSSSPKLAWRNGRVIGDGRCALGRFDLMHERGGTNAAKSHLSAISWTTQFARRNSGRWAPPLRVRPSFNSAKSMQPLTGKNRFSCRRSVTPQPQRVTKNEVPIVGETDTRWPESLVSHERPENRTIEGTVTRWRGIGTLMQPGLAGDTSWPPLTTASKESTVQGPTQTRHHSVPSG
jgi:hypothetical protein